MWYRLVRLFFGLCIIFLGVAAHAQVQVEEFVSLGHKRCVEAHMASRFDIEQAERLYDEYLALKNALQQTSPATFEQSEKGVKRTVNYCAQVESHIKDKKSVHVFKQAYKHCADAETFIANMQLPKAERALAKYVALKQKAFEIAKGPLDKQYLRKQIEKCTLLADDLVLAKPMVAAISPVRKARQECTKKLAQLTRDKQVSVDQIQQVRDDFLTQKNTLAKVKVGDSLGYLNFLNNDKKRLTACVESFSVLATSRIDARRELELIAAQKAEQELQEKLKRESLLEQQQLELQKHQADILAEPTVVEATVVAKVKDYPAYPEKARSPVVGSPIGFVDVSYTVNSQGTTENIRIVDAKPARVFNRAVIRAVKEWTFNVDNVDTPAVFEERIEFNPYK